MDVYVPWNLHEPRRGEFDFGEGSSQFSTFLNITRFLELVKEEDLLAILRLFSDEIFSFDWHPPVFIICMMAYGKVNLDFPFI